MSTEPERPRTSVRAVRERLDRVTDPELDESIVELGYVDEITVDDRRVRVAFTLPTAWCSPAFAWMMATDTREATEALPGVDRTHVRLREHLHETEITEGVNEGLAFQEVFPDADGGVAEVRATLDAKARLARQHEAVEALLEAGLGPEQVTALEFADLWLDEPAAVFVREGSVGISVPAEPLDAYLVKARETGLVGDDHPHLFRTPDGNPISTERFELVQRRCRLATVNMGGQESVCEALNDARRDENRPPLSPTEHIP